MSKKKWYLSRKQDNLCYLCGFPMEDDVTIDEIIPQWHGGIRFAQNQAVAHYMCNSRKSAMSYDEYIFLLERNMHRVYHPLQRLFNQLSLIR